MPPSLQAQLSAADQLRQAGHWPQALAAYEAVLRQHPAHALAAHNSAVCHMTLGQLPQAIERSQQAQRLNPAQWQSGLLCAMAQHQNGQSLPALHTLQQLHRQHPTRAPIALELARRQLHTLCAPLQCAATVAHLLSSPEHGTQARQMTLLAQLYDRPPELRADPLNQQLIAHARRHLQAPASTALPPPTKGTRLRIGIVSNQLHSSPVYYLAIGVLRELARQCSLTVFCRASRGDWASDEFRRIATDWVDVQEQSVSQLTNSLRQHPVDVLIDLCGWMDPVALQALSTRPAPRQYTWVGGQSLTTGLDCFDGFITDEHHTPPGSEPLYTEPLLRMPGGYVSYSPPPYLPEPQQPPTDTLLLGLIANPAKLSAPCLQHLREHWPDWQARSPRPLQLQLIDQRYRIAPLRQRIQAQLQGLPLQFITPDSHASYLQHTARLHAVIDSWPYSGGLTTLEAHSLGVPVYTRSQGTLFCERHSRAHNHYLGLHLPALDSPDFSPAHALQVDRSELRQRALLRQRHAPLAQALLAHLNA